MLQCVAMWCSVLHCVAASILAMLEGPDRELQGVSCVAGCCSVLQWCLEARIASCMVCHVLQCVACVAVCCMCCSLLQSAAVCCSVSRGSDMYWINTIF